MIQRRMRQALVLAIQVGDGDGWEPGIYPGVGRVFARYQPDEISALVRQTGFTVQAVAEGESGSRPWLHLIASVSR